MIHNDRDSTNDTSRPVRTRLRRWDVPGAVYAITAATLGRVPIFADDGNVQVLLENLRSVKAIHPFGMRAYAILPDHLHLLIALPDNGHITSVMHSIQRNTTLNLKKHWGGTAETHLWQSQFWDHVIRSDLDYDNHMGYIHYNPVKHGLVATPGDHAYSSFQEYVRRGWYGPTWSENVELAVGVRIELE